jgi:hypothetical protein
MANMPDVHQSPLADDDQVSANRPRFTELIGFGLSIVGFLAFVVTLESLAEKLVAVVASGSVAAVAWRALRDRANGKLTNGMLFTLGVAAIAMLGLVVVVDNAGGRSAHLGGGLGRDPTERQSPPSRSSTSSPGRPPAVSLDTSVWLTDLPKPADDNGWVTGLRKVAGTSYPHSYIATVASSPSCAESVPMIEFDLDGLYQRLQTTVGVSNSADTATRAVFAVSLDGVEAKATHSIVRGEREEIDLSVSGVDRLRLTVRNANQCGGWYVFGDPRLGR